MGIASGPPTSGFRLTLARTSDAPPWRYEGVVQFPARALPVAAVVEASGEVRVEIAPPDDALAERVRLLVRSVCKHGEGRPPPMRIQRWRPDA